jgi:hypothetical protein
MYVFGRQNLKKQEELISNILIKKKKKRSSVLNIPTRDGAV